MTVKPAVYKFGYRGRIFYRLCLYPHEGQKKLARELKTEPDKIEIMDGGRKQ